MSEPPLNRTKVVINDDVIDNNMVVLDLYIYHIDTHSKRPVTMALPWWSQPSKEIHLRISNHKNELSKQKWMIKQFHSYRIVLRCLFVPWYENQRLHDFDDRNPLFSRFLEWLVCQLWVSNMFGRDLCTDETLCRDYLLLQTFLKTERFKIIFPWKHFVHYSILTETICLCYCYFWKFNALIIAWYL